MELITPKTYQPFEDSNKEIIGSTTYSIHRNKALQKHSFQSLTVISAEECFNQCVKHRPTCKTYNLGPPVDGSMVCDLNSEWKEDVSEVYFTDQMGTVYYELIV